MVEESQQQEQFALADVLRSPGGYERVLSTLKPTAHPVLPVPDAETLLGYVLEHGDAKLVELFARRERAIEKEKLNPIYFGYEPPMWKDADALLEKCKDILICGGNRASKSEYAAKRCVQMMEKKPGAVVWCLSTSHETSVRDQQKLIWKYLPFHWKKAAKTRVTRILYTQSKGFSDRVFVAPNGSECRFMNYQQEREVVEGGQIDLWWGDEEIPLDWIVTLRGRTVDRRGKGIVTFTPVTGFTASIGEYFTGATVVQSTDCELMPSARLWPGLPVGKVPYVMECLNPQHAVIFFQPKWNPYIPYDELLAVWKGKPTQEILIRIHGITQKTSGNVFPRFGKHNIVPHEKIASILKATPHTKYHVLDFAYNRNWAQIWLAVSNHKGRKRVYIYREWPDFDTYGDWVVPSDKPDGARGPAQATLGFGIARYKELITGLEQQGICGEPEDVYARYGDPRSGAATTLAEEGAATIFQMLENSDSGMPMLVEPVAGKEGAQHILEGVNLINQWLEYDTDRALSPMNEPMLYASDKCVNWINCMKIWTGRDGDKGASKDFVDLTRYAAIMDVDYHDVAAPMFLAGGSY